MNPKRSLCRHLDLLLDQSGALGVGLVDAQGFLIHGAGGHGGYRSAELAAHLAGLNRYAGAGLGQLTGEGAGEQIVISGRHTFYLLAFGDQPYLLYAVAPEGARPGRIRLELARAHGALAPLLGGQGLLGAPRQRLEEPRQFLDPMLAWKAP